MTKCNHKQVTSTRLQTSRCLGVLKHPQILSNYIILLYILSHVCSLKAHVVDVVNEFVSRNSTRFIFLEDSCKVFHCLLLFQLASNVFQIPQYLKIFRGSMPPDPPTHAGHYAPGRAAFGSQINTPKPKNLSTALQYMYSYYSETSQQTHQGQRSSQLQGGHPYLESWIASHTLIPEVTNRFYNIKGVAYEKPNQQFRVDMYSEWPKLTQLGGEEKLSEQTLKA